MNDACSGGGAEAMPLAWCHRVDDQLSKLTADIGDLRRSLEETQERLQVVADRQWNGDRAPSRSWQEELAQQSQQLRAQLAEGLRNAELNHTMAVNRIASSTATEAAQRESVLRHQVSVELSEMHSALRHDCAAVEAACTTRLEAALAQGPRFNEEHELRQTNLSFQVQGIGTRLAGVEEKGSHLANWLESEVRAGRASVAELAKSVDSMQRDHAQLRETLNECSEGVANAAVGVGGAAVTTSQLADQIQGVEMQVATALARAIAAEECHRDEIVLSLSAKHAKQQERLESLQSLVGELGTVHGEHEAQHAMNLKCVKDHTEQIIKRLTDLEVRVRKQKSGPGSFWLVQADDDDSISAEDLVEASFLAHGCEERSNPKMGRILGVVAAPSPMQAGILHAARQRKERIGRTAWSDDELGPETNPLALTVETVPEHERNTLHAAPRGSGKVRSTFSVSGHWLRGLAGALPLRGGPRTN